MIRSFIILCLYIPIVSQLQAQETRFLNLEDAIKIAQEQSPDALIAIHSFRSSYWAYRSFKATYLPSVNLEATIPNINRSIDPITLPDGSEQFTARSLTNYSINLSVNQRIGLTGGNVFISSGIQRLDNFSTDTSTSQYLSTPINIGFTQPIFQYNEYKWSKRLEPLKYQSAKKSFIESNEDIAIKTISRFFQLMLAQIELSIAHKNQSNYDTLFNIAKGRYNLGKIAENELLQLELNLLQANASVEQAELDYDNQMFQFKSFLRIQTHDTIVLIPPVPVEYFEVNLSQALQEAKTNTSTVLGFEQQLLEARSEVNRAKMDGRFDANLFAVFGLTGSGPQIEDAYRDPLNEERLTLGISVPILDWGESRGRIKLAESNQELVRTSVEQEQIDFEQDIFLQVTRFNMQKNQLNIAAKADTVAQKRYDVTQKRYMIGKVNDILELNSAQIDNDNARKGYYQALQNYWRSYYEIRRSTLYDFEKAQPIMIEPEVFINR